MSLCMSKYTRIIEFKNNRNNNRKFRKSMKLKKCRNAIINSSKYVTAETSGSNDSYLKTIALACYFNTLNGTP